MSTSQIKRQGRIASIDLHIEDDKEEKLIMQIYLRRKKTFQGAMKIQSKTMLSST